jgi:serine/threonine protein kinase
MTWAPDELIDPVEFVQPASRMFVDTNVFIETRPGFQGGLKVLFERCSPTILRNGSPIVVPTKVQDELRVNQGKLLKSQPDKAAKAHNALIFLRSATDAGLVRTGLGDVSNPYADDLFLDLFKSFGSSYSMCLLTFDITPKLRVRLLARQTGRRLIAGHPSKHGDIAVESGEVLFRKGHHKLAKLVANGGDPREIAELEIVLPQFEKDFGLDGALTRSSLIRLNQARSLAATATSKPFAMTSKIKPRDTALAFTSLPAEGDQVTWESASKKGVLVLGPLLGEGGEGAVFAGSKNTVVKIFDKDHITQHRKKKIELLVNSGLQAKGVCIPTVVVQNNAGEFVGYVMPRASGRVFQRTIFNKRKFEKEFPNWVKADLVDICISFLEKVEYLHSMNIILGDISPKNLMIDDQKNVFIIDADSWQVEGYPCPVGTPMFTAPRMLGKTYADDLRTVEDELFAVATMLFMIVMTGQFPYIRTGTDGDMVQLIKEGNFAFQYENRNNGDQPDGDWKYMWSHVHKPVKGLFWHTFHSDGRRYKKRPTATEWLAAFRGYKSFLENGRLNFDPMSNQIYPIRNKAFKPDTPIQDCPSCGRKNAIAGIWNDDDAHHFIPKQCNKCRNTLSLRGDTLRVAVTSRLPSASQLSAPSLSACKDCGVSVLRAQLVFGRCRACATKAGSLDPSRLCVECRRPFITNDHIGWFRSRLLDLPKSHAAIKQSCQPTQTSLRRPPTKPSNQSFWARVKKLFLGF